MKADAFIELLLFLEGCVHVYIHRFTESINLAGHIVGISKNFNPQASFSISAYDLLYIFIILIYHMHDFE